MPDVQTFRPVSTAVAGTWTPSAGTLASATSDDNDSTYALQVVGGLLSDPIGTTMRLVGGNHTPPADHERHRVRLRIRGGEASGITWRSRSRWFVGSAVSSVFTRNIPGSIVGPVITTFAGPYSSPSSLPPAGTSLVQVSVQPEAISNSGIEARVMELWVDVDSRAAPAYTAEVWDGTGTPQNGGTVTDTTVPRFVFDSVAYDGLPARDWQMFLYTLGQTLAGGFAPFATTPFRQTSGVGAAPTALFPVDVGAIPNGQYVAYFRASSTIRGADPFPTVETVAFTMNVDTPPPPVLTVTVQAPDAEVCWIPGPPTGTDWDNPDEVVIEVQRSDCFRDFFGIHTAPSPLSNCFIDRFVPLFDDCAACDEDEDEYNCEVLYRARYWGMVGDILMSTDWSGVA